MAKKKKNCDYVKDLEILILKILRSGDPYVKDLALDAITCILLKERRRENRHRHTEKTQKRKRQCDH